MGWRFTDTVGKAWRLTGLQYPSLADGIADFEDPYKCSALRDRGHWLAASDDGSGSYKHQSWQPPGCMMHDYNQDDIVICLTNQRLVFIGDSSTRQIFEAVVEKLGHDLSQVDSTWATPTDEKHKNFQANSHSTTVQFFWDPWLNSTNLDHALEQHNSTRWGTTVLVLGAPGLWYARYGDRNYLKSYRETIDRVVPYMDHSLDARSSVLDTSIGLHMQRNIILMVPTQIPKYDILSGARHATITPEKVDQMNEYLYHISKSAQTNILWSYSAMTAGQGIHDVSGMHVIQRIAHAKADVVLNLACNFQARLSSIRYDRICCTNYENRDFLYILVLSIFGISQLFWSPRRANHGANLSRAVSAVLSFLSVLLFSHLTDRTQMFEKANKQFRGGEFGVGCLAFVLLGCFSLQKVTVLGEKARKNRCLLLCRDQTDEWKGWMQAVILLYHYCGASQILELYKIARVLVASYLFLTGYGHTTSLLQSNNFTLERGATVLLRLNILTVALSYVMDTNYLFYYFPAMTSFWFVVIWTVLWIGKSSNHKTLFVACKISLSMICTVCLVKLPWIFECVAVCLHTLCSISWDVEEWRFRLFLDPFAVYVGMMVALIQHNKGCGRVKDQPLGEHASRYQSPSKSRTDSTFGRPAVILSVVALFTFWGITKRCPDKQSYNAIHPFVSWIPILCFIVLRNSHSQLQRVHSGIFSWLGRISLETYVLQYHVWLAGDTTGILRIGLFNRGIEMLILTLLFIGLGWSTASLTKELTTWLVTTESSLADPQRSLPQAVTCKYEANTRDVDCRWISVLKYRLRSDLRWRLAAIMVGLWVANIFSGRRSS